MCNPKEFYGVIVGDSTSLYGCDWDDGRLDEVTAQRKARRLAGETREPVYLVKAELVERE